MASNVIIIIIIIIIFCAQPKYHFIKASTVLTIPNFPVQTSFLPQTSQLSLFKKKKHCYFVPNKVVSCKETNENRNQPTTPSSNNIGDPSLNKFDTRDVLVGLGGLYGATTLADGNDPFALATTIPAPNLTSCREVTITNKTAGTSKTVNCCPPKNAKVTDFRPPKFSKIRYRPPAHLVDPKSDYFAKFAEAMKRMKALPADDPRSFMQQANVHCAYCYGAYSYKVVGSPEHVIQVHHSWLFFPFHRLYLYFFERILGKLIDDPDFAMPFWNWDDPDGMTIPAIYVNSSSPLYDGKRNVNHQSQKLVDLDYHDTDEARDLITSNLKIMYRQMVSNSKNPTLFHGAAYRLGDKPCPGMGTIENCPHNNVHDWCGDKRQPNSEDMGILYSAGRDPLFYAHHSNVDRMWSIWKTLPERNSKKRTDFTDRDWLDASFVFYDENANLVRAKVRDCLDTKTLGYEYQKVDIRWLRIEYKPIPRFVNKGKRNQAGSTEAETKIPKDGIVLDKKRSYKIPREKKSRNRVEKEEEEEEEVLVLENIQLDRDEWVKFDVYINTKDEEPTGPEYSEFAGSFSNLPHGHDDGKKLETNFTLAISDLLEDLDAEGDDNIVVTLMPKIGDGVTVGNIKIDFIRE